MRGADILVKALMQAGVRRIFSLSGNQIMPVYDACFEAGIEIVHTRHEAAAVYMAEAHAQLTGQIGVAMVTAGVGSANALGPLLTASESDTPVLLLTGDSPVAMDGRGAFQEMPQQAMIAPLVKCSFRSRTADDLGRDVARACRSAQSGRPGPAHISLAFDVLNETSEGGAIPPVSAFKREYVAPGEADLARLIDTLSAAERPVILCGPLLNSTRFDGLNDLANAVDAPVIAMESPRGLKDPSLGNLALVLKQADLVVSLGKRVDFTLGFGGVGPFNKAASWVTVLASSDQRDQAHRNLADRLKLSLVADPRDMAQALIERGGTDSRRADWRSAVSARIAERHFPQVSNGKITPAELCGAVQRQIDALTDPVLICDGGEFGQWAQAATQAPNRIINGISGAIGGGLCYAMAARLARPQSTVFALMGDGTAGFHFSEFETAAREGIACVAVIGNDLRWNAEHQIQLHDYGADRLIGCQLSAARYDLAAEAFGGHGEYVTEISQLDDALRRAIESGKPACVNVLIDGLPAPAGAAH